MARISGVDLPREKRVEIGLTYIYGIGLSTSQKILAETGVNPDTRVKDLTEEEVNAIRNFVKNITVEGKASSTGMKLIQLGECAFKDCTGLESAEFTGNFVTDKKY